MRAAARIDDILGDGAGTIGPGAWLVPAAVDLRDGWLVPDWSMPGTAVEASAGLLRGFLALAMPGTDARILAYAREAGMLGLSKLEVDRAEGPPSTLPGPERVDQWTDLARQAKTAVLLAHRARARQRRGELVERGLERPPVRQLFPPAWWLEIEMDWWMRMADVRPRLLWRGDGPSVSLGSGTLLGELAVRLLHAVAGGGDLMMMCADCGEWVAAKRRPPAGAAYRCRDCRGAAYARRYRELNRADPGRARLRRGRPSIHGAGS